MQRVRLSEECVDHRQQEHREQRCRHEPAITTVASGRCTSLPGAVETAMGMNPSEATSAVIRRDAKLALGLDVREEVVDERLLREKRFANGQATRLDLVGDVAQGLLRRSYACGIEELELLLAQSDRLQRSRELETNPAT